MDSGLRGSHDKEPKDVDSEKSTCEQFWKSNMESVDSSKTDDFMNAGIFIEKSPYIDFSAQGKEF